MSIVISIQGDIEAHVTHLNACKHRKASKVCVSHGVESIATRFNCRHQRQRYPSCQISTTFQSVSDVQVTCVATLEDRIHFTVHCFYLERSKGLNTARGFKPQRVLKQVVVQIAVSVVMYTIVARILCLPLGESVGYITQHWNVVIHWARRRWLEVQRPIPRIRRSRVVTQVSRICRVFTRTYLYRASGSTRCPRRSQCQPSGVECEPGRSRHSNGVVPFGINGEAIVTVRSILVGRYLTRSKHGNLAA